MLYDLGRYDDALTTAQTADSVIRAAVPLTSAGFRPAIAMLHARNGEVARAQKILAEVHDTLVVIDSTQMDIFWLSSAEVFLAQNMPDSALAARSQVSKKGRHFWLDRTEARAHLALGHPAEAIAAIQRYLGKFDDDAAGDPGLIIGAHYLLGQAYEQSGWHDKAIETYEHFLDLWRDADDNIPMLIDARARLARLKESS
jgi:tetratricopeptide (TPR) repeat protein